MRLSNSGGAIHNSPTIKNKFNFSGVVPYFYILPALILFGIFVLYPLISGIYDSFFNVKMLSNVHDFVGFKNYIAIFKDPIFKTAIANNVLYTFWNMIIDVSWGILLASLLCIKGIKGVKFFRTVYLLPFIIPLIGSAFMFKLIFNQQYGIFNAILKVIGLGQFTKAWLGSFPEALFIIYICSTWIFMGYYILLINAAMQRIPVEIYEAAELDGIGYLKKLFLITIPLIKDTLTMIIGLIIMDSFLQYGLFFMITKGNPMHKTEVVATWMLNNAFNFDKLSYGLAMAITLLIIIAVLTLGFLWLRSRGETYEY